MIKAGKELGLAAFDNVVAFKLVWFRVAAYFFIPAGMLFLTQTETYSSKDWDNMGPFLRNRLYLACTIAGSTALCAYLDSSLQRAKDRASVMKDDREVVARVEAKEEKAAEAAKQNERKD